MWPSSRWFILIGQSSPRAIPSQSQIWILLARCAREWRRRATLWITLDAILTLGLSPRGSSMRRSLRYGRRYSWDLNSTITSHYAFLYFRLNTAKLRWRRLWSSQKLFLKPISIKHLFHNTLVQLYKCNLNWVLIIGDSPFFARMRPHTREWICTGLHL